jgi:hypothetical protein
MPEKCGNEKTNNAKMDRVPFFAKATTSFNRFYRAKVKRNPVVNKTSFFLRPGAGSLKYLSLTVNCQDSHFLNTVAVPKSKFMRYSPVLLRLLNIRNDWFSVVLFENL